MYMEDFHDVYCDILWILQIDFPCIPCINDCSLYSCNSSCSTDNTILKVFSLDNLNLTSKRNSSTADELATYYLTGIHYLTYLNYFICLMNLFTKINTKKESLIYQNFDVFSYHYRQTNLSRIPLC